MLRIFTPVKIQRLRPGLNPQTWVPEASILTTRPPKPSIEGKIKGEMEVTRRRGRRRRKLLDDLKNRRVYSHLKEEALDRTMWRNRFGGGFEPVVRQNIE